MAYSTQSDKKTIISMRKIIYPILGSLLFTLFGCGSHTIIPDDELSLIFKDAFLTNSYINQQGSFSLDSLNIYEPIFAHYGYTTDDVHYTIGNFSKRKSARLGDVVEVAIDMLKREDKHYEKEVAILDTINNVSRRRYTHIIYSDSLIKVYKLRDTSRLQFRFNDILPGEYTFTCKYKIDSTTKQGSIRGYTYMERMDSTKKTPYSFALNRNRDREQQFTRTYKTDTTINRLIIDLITFKEKPINPKITVRDLTLTYIPSYDTARDSLYHDGVDIRVFSDQFLNGKKDSL